VSAWGVTDIASCIAWINPSTPIYRLLDVVRHEYMHVLQCRNYGGNWRAEEADAGGMSEIERIADAGAIQQGAQWTLFTQNPTSFERRAAARLLAGERMV